MKEKKSAIDRNIETIHSLRIEADQNRRLDQKFVDHVAVFAGSTNSIYYHIVFYGLCFLITRKLETIGMVASLEAIVLSVFVLINQKRMNSLERRHSDLHLQTSLLVESEITRLARAVDLIAQKLDVELTLGANLEEAKKEVRPLEVLKRISEQENNAPTHSTLDKKK